MRRLHDQYFGLGPLFFEGGEGGAGGAPPEGDSPKADPPKAEPPPKEDRSGMVPRERFDAVNSELIKLREAEEARQRRDLEAKGEHQKIAESEKAKREAAEARALAIARRAAFIGAAAGKVSDPEAAYKLAMADGLLSDLDVDDDGNAKDPKATPKVVEAVIAKYEFLKPKGDRSYGGDRSGAGGNQEVGDLSKLTSRELLAAGYAQSSGRTRGS